MKFTITNVPYMHLRNIYSVHNTLNASKYSMLATVHNCLKELDKTNRVNERIHYKKQLGYNIGLRCIGATSSRVKSVCKN